MPTFCRRSLANLAECHPDLRVLFAEVIKTHDCSVICGERSEAEQSMAVANGTSHAAWPTSMHNVDGATRSTSWAADVVPYPLDWKDTASFHRLAEVVTATAANLLRAGKMRYEVRWGGTFRGLVDMPHYELVGVTRGE